ncbi:MAG: isocitrate lyase/PEP mutase family protein, partial [Acidimicrobiales bacterium]
MAVETNPVPESQRALAATFRDLHREGIFLMPCAWDAGSARVLQAAGFVALGTTSGGVNWSRGRQDYVYSVPRESMLAEYGEIAMAVSLPVSGDLENGYGQTPSEVGETIRAAIGAGMVGGSIEDQSDGPDPGLIPIELAAERIEAARRAADALLPDFTVTARAESYFAGVADPFDDAVERTNRYVEAGADCVFVPGLSDLDSLKRLVDSVGAPVSLGVGAG